MSMILSALLPVLESLGARVRYDAGGPGLIAIGLVLLLAFGAGIAFLIVMAVLLIRYLKKKNANRD